MAKNFAQTTAALALLILIPTTDVAHASEEDDDDDIEEVVVIGQRLKERGIFRMARPAPLGPSGYRPERRSGAAAPPGPADSPDADVQKVKDCANDGENIFDEAEEKGDVSVSYSDLLVPTPTGGVAYGRANWLGGRSVGIIVYTSTLAARFGKNSDAYWREYTITLLHEYRHAVDMFACRCNLESQLRSPSYEPQTEKAARDDYDRLYAGNESCLAR